MLVEPRGPGHSMGMRRPMSFLFKLLVEERSENEEMDLPILSNSTTFPVLSFFFFIPRRGVRQVGMQAYSSKGDDADM